MNIRLGRKKGKSAGPGCLILFSLPFAAVGVFMTILFMKDLLKGFEVKNWPARPAAIIQAKLETHRGDDSTTYKAVARYRYTVDGRSFTGDRVSIHGGADNVGSFQKNAYEELKGYVNSGKKFRCYVNPDDPSESVIYNKIRWEMIILKGVFAVVFGGVGFGLMFGSLMAYKKSRREQKLAAERPDQPWLHREEWRGGVIKESSGKAAIFIFIFALFWNLVSLAVLFPLISEILERRDPKLLLVLIFPGIGILLILWVVYILLRKKKYGESRFEMDAMPGVIGGPVSGFVICDKKFDAPDGFEATLSCINRYTSGTGKNRSTREKVLWQDEKRIQPRAFSLDPAKTCVPVEFAAPYDCPETRDDNPSDKILWRLELKAETPGVDYGVKFEIPVFKTEDSSPDYRAQYEADAAHEIQESPEAALRRERIFVEQSPGGVRWIFPMLRQPAAAVGLLIFCLIWTVVVVFLTKSDAPIIFPLVFGFLDVIIFLAMLNLFFGSSVIRVENGELYVKRKFLGIGFTRRMPAGAIEKIYRKRGMQSGNKLYYNVYARSRDGKKLKIASGLGSQTAAQLMETQIKNNLNLEN